MSDATLALTSQRRRVVRFALLVAAGIAAVELVHTVRILMVPVEQRRFPHDYVSRGVWATYAYIRPLDRTSSDISPPLAAAEKVLRSDPQLYAEFNQTGLCFIYPPTAATELLPFGWVARRRMPGCIAPGARPASGWSIRCGNTRRVTGRLWRVPRPACGR